jgi:hypothetical protein
MEGRGCEGGPIRGKFPLINFPLLSSFFFDHPRSPNLYLFCCIVPHILLLYYFFAYLCGKKDKVVCRGKEKRDETTE